MKSITFKTIAAGILASLLSQSSAMAQNPVWTPPTVVQNNLPYTAQQFAPNQLPHQGAIPMSTIPGNTNSGYPTQNFVPAQSPYLPIQGGGVPQVHQLPNGTSYQCGADGCQIVPSNSQMNHPVFAPGQVNFPVGNGHFGQWQGQQVREPAFGTTPTTLPQSFPIQYLRYRAPDQANPDGSQPLYPAGYHGNSNWNQSQFHLNSDPNQGLGGMGTIPNSSILPGSMPFNPNNPMNF